jgi:pseudouridine-5'-phosphate glycosidase
MSVIIADEIRDALDSGRPVVALETAVLTSGLPRCRWKESYGEPPSEMDADSPINTAIALTMTDIIRSNGAIPAWIGILRGSLVVGLSSNEVLELAGNPQATKVSLASCASTMQCGGTAGTTVAATLHACKLACETNPIRVFATGGIGGIHQNWNLRLDVSADLTALATTPTCVVASGAKSILDLDATVESLETIGVPVLGLGHARFPRFVEKSSEDDPCIQRVDDVSGVASICNTHWHDLGLSSSVLATTRVPAGVALDRGCLQEVLEKAEYEWISSRQPSTTRTPFLLDQLATATCGRSLVANLGLLCNNALTASKIAIAIRSIS